MNHSARFLVASPAPTVAGSALAVIQLTADDAGTLEHALRSLGVAPPAVGRFALADLAGVDRGVVARWTPTCAHLMPHGGALVVRDLCQRLAATPGIAAVTGREPDAASILARYPEADDLVEACMLDALARAASPLAIDVLLHQRDLWRHSPSLWQGAESSRRVRDSSSPADARALNHLIDPPTVVLLGPPNAGKSTLTNALARRPVSIVADEPGTTRDHVGVMLDLAGLVVRWIDAPGMNPDSTDPIERAAIDLALAVAEHADLLILCHDGGWRVSVSPLRVAGATSDPRAFHTQCSWVSRRRPTHAAPPPILHVATRADLGEPTPPPEGFAAVTAALHSRGLADLALAVRESLVPSRLLRADELWQFHPALSH